MAKFRFRPEGLAKLRKAAAPAGTALTDTELANAIGVHRTTVYRVLNGEMPPGIPFLAGAVLAFGWEWLSDLFEAVSDDKTETVAS